VNVRLPDENEKTTHFTHARINKYAFRHKYFLTEFVKERTREAMSRFDVHTCLFLSV